MRLACILCTGAVSVGLSQWQSTSSFHLVLFWEYWWFWLLGYQTLVLSGCGWRINHHCESLVCYWISVHEAGCLTTCPRNRTPLRCTVKQRTDDWAVLQPEACAVTSACFLAFTFSCLLETQPMAVQHQHNQVTSQNKASHGSSRLSINEKGPREAYLPVEDATYGSESDSSICAMYLVR